MTTHLQETIQSVMWRTLQLAGDRAGSPETQEGVYFTSYLTTGLQWWVCNPHICYWTVLRVSLLVFANVKPNIPEAFKYLNIPTLIA